MQIPIFLINLDHRRDRLETMQSRLQGLHVRRVSAVPGSSVTETFRQRRGIPERLTNNEVGCYLSHEIIWKTMLDENLAIACVMEDDLIAGPDLTRFLDSMIWDEKPFDVIKLDNWPPSPNRISVDRHGLSILNRSIHRLKSMTYSSACYLVTQQAAKQLLHISKNIENPIDILLFSEIGHWMPQNLVFQLVPAVATQEQHIMEKPTRSDIQHFTIHVSDERNKELPRKRAVVWKLRREFSKLPRQLKAFIKWMIVEKFQTMRIAVPFEAGLRQLERRR